MEPDPEPVPDAEQLVVMVQKLKEVFDMCDEDSDGFIRVQHLVDLGVQFGPGHEEVKKFVKFLDPDAHGRINFKDFCHGVFAIKGCGDVLKTALGSPPIDRPPYQTHNGYYQQASPLIMCTEPFPDCPLYPSEGPITHESDMDSGAPSETSENGRHDDKEEGLGGLFLPGNNSCVLVHSAAASVISAEEQFEDYGEGEDVDFTPSSPCPDDETRTNGFSDLGSSLPSSAGQTPQKIRHLYNSELLDVYCSQCCKKVNLLNDLEARLKNLKANSPNRKISSTAFGRQLFHHSNFSSSQGSTEDLFRDSIDSCDIDITEKVLRHTLTMESLLHPSPCSPCTN
ncbi:rab11 family-interacting protein 4A-like [Hoplias malabaricus]|uniref:rab11 family-interacting protein 4A-like n=1 Tax=Hoplias malabaricus TaxID=27720 RepID=UPI003461B571